MIRWQSASNKYYTVQATTNLITGFNLNLRTNIPATPPENVHTDNVGTAGQKFYRIKVGCGARGKRQGGKTKKMIVTCRNILTFPE